MLTTIRNDRHVAHGFTLVEILVVIVILGVMGGMVVSAVNGVTTTARHARTKQIIAVIDSVIQEQYDSYKYRPLAVEVPDLFQSTGTYSMKSDEIGREVLAREAMRVRLMMVRDLQRMEMPERFSDFRNPPVNILAACNPVRVTGGVITGTRDDPSSRTPLPVSWRSADNPKRQIYNSRYVATATPEHQSAECLYLIMATSFVGGTPAIDAIPASNIGDTDGDGMPEILDGWGRPIGFVRWPVGYFDPDGSIDTDSPDDFDPFRVDFVNTGTSDAVKAVDVNAPTGYVRQPPWPLRPLVVSAGDDGEFGIALDPIDASGSALPLFNYVDVGAWYWPIDAAHMGPESAGRQPPNTQYYIFPDPYLRRFIAANDPTATSRSDTQRRLPGEILSATDTVESIDNVTNYELQVVK
ncbi:MAG: type II secretion system protein [Novipirellula sp. JB048]